MYFFDNTVICLVLFVMFLARHLSPARMTALNVALTVALLMAGLLVVRDLISMRQNIKLAGDIGPVSEKSSAHSPREALKPFQSYAQVVEQNVFGIQSGPLSRLEGKVSSSAQVSSDLKVLGIIAWPSGFGYAMLTMPGGGQDVFRTGQMIPQSGKLKRVKPHSVFIESGGKVVELPMVEDVTATSSRAPSPKQGADFAQKTSETGYTIDKEALRESIDNPKNLMTDARLVPNMEGGVQKGFILRELRQGGIYQKLGLQNGDVLMRVNEFAISDAESALQAFTAIKGLDRVDLDVIRGGTRMTLTYLVQ